MIIKILQLSFFLLISAYAQDFKIASYNVENLFDLNNDGTEYKEYIPNDKSNWNRHTYTIKLKNISQVINELDSDILALQEVESKRALTDLLKFTPQYKYSSFIKNKKSAIGLALISKYPIINTKRIQIKSSNPYARPIQKSDIKIKNKNITVYNNHWPSKRASENARIEYALSLQKYLSKNQPKNDYIILGDFNSNYDEFRTFKQNKKLNNTYGITGINQVLNTTVNKKFITKSNILKFKDVVHYNLWLEKDYANRFSYKYKNSNNTPDNILINSTLFDNKNISYVNNSFKTFKPNYLFKNNSIQRWVIKGKDRLHKGSGYSDHLPIYALFSTKQKFKQLKDKKNNILDLSQLYDIENLAKASKIYNAIVIYKNRSNAIIKQKNNRAVYIYKEAANLDLGKSYDLEISKIKTYNGLKEIAKINKSVYKNDFADYKNLYLDANRINILNFKYQNEILTQLQGTYKKGYLYYKYNNKNEKIKLYSKDKSLLPKNGQKVNIMSGHLGFYMSKPQIIIYKESDYIVN